ncbi:response regulator [Marinomonas sp. C2222]|uniref:histidine kinase n=1 Tax=Marinomonas sargassi TaxID=2984494 RepID=A0ABT2YUD7_9GAMM|nr:response regulator [Marinomonas sargassi]MCV2403516.1 response regulator [Marinomonas sargassi]
MEEMIKGKSFLIVDDQEAVRQLVSRSLSQLGAGNVIQAASGTTAMKIVESQQCDFIICDWNMPKMNGVDLLKEVRRLPSYKKIPFLMITAETDKRRVMEVISSGVTDFLVKPFNVKALKEKIERCFLVGSPEGMAQYLQSNLRPPAAKVEEKSTLLVVDDVASNVDVLVNLFQKEYRVKVASSGEQALKICFASPPDLILMDVSMPPGMSGFEACEELQKNPDTQGIPVIFLTSRDSSVDMTKGFEIGGVDYVIKPSEPAIVKARVKNHLRLKSGRDSMAQELDLMLENSRLREEMQLIIRHDLKTPLIGMIYHLTELIDNPDIPKDATNHILSMESASYRMLAMINSSQKLIKIEQGTYKSKQEKVDLDKIVLRIEQDLQGIMNEKSVSFAAHSEDPWYIVGEELLCYILAENLLKNAIEASDDNSEIKIQFSKVDSMVVLEIENTGTVPESIRGNFFDKFSTAEKEDGSGIGTHSARLMARAQRGDIKLECGESTTKLVVTLPSWED